MQTIYFETPHFIRHESNLVDLCAYRERLDAAVGQSWPAEPPPEEAAPVLRLCPPVTAAARRRRRLRRLPLLLDLCASLAVVLMATVAIVRFLAL